MDKIIALGTNKGKPRIWIEGSWLHDLGFSRGRSFTATLSGQTLTLALCAERTPGRRTVSGKDKGNKPHPIIDLTGEWLTPMITADRRLALSGSRGRIVITPALADQVNA